MEDSLGIFAILLVSGLVAAVLAFVFSLAAREELPSTDGGVIPSSLPLQPPDAPEHPEGA